MYREPATGKTWSGRGKPPNWIKDLDQTSRDALRIIVDREGSMDTLTVEVEMSETLFSDDLADVIALERAIERELHAETGIQARCVLVNPQTIERSEGKAKRVFDRRKVTTHV